MLQATLKPKRCKECGGFFTPMRPMAVVCGLECSARYATKQSEKKRSKAAKEERAQTRARKEAMKPRKEFLAEAKQAVQRFRRLEELKKGSPCMSCQRSQAEVEGADGWKPGGAWDGGHFMGKGARPELALEPLNVWLQCKSCNAGSGKYARKGYTVNANFETNLRATQGDALVDWLKGPHEPKHYDTDELKDIRDHYRKRARELEKTWNR